MKVAISGGGVAGLSVAAALAERGHAVQVFERFNSEPSMGAGVVCFPNATLVLRHFGLEGALREIAGTPLTMRRISRDGESLGDLRISTINERVGAPSYAVLRTDLHNLLSRLARDRGVMLQYSCEVRGVSDENRLVLSDGRQVDADWIIGADGRMNSPLRRYVLGENKPRYGGFVNWIGVAKAQEDVFDPHVVLDVWGCGERFGVVPISQRIAYFAGGAVAPLGEPTHVSLLSKLKERFSGWPDPIAAALGAAEPNSVREIYVHDHDPIQVWHRGRVLLVGDAAHAPLPTSGQGACQALEDAYHMAQLLDSGGPLAPSAFFRCFTERRREKANAIISSGRAFAAMVFNDSPQFVANRNRRSQLSDLSEAAVGMANLWSRALAT